MSRYNCVESDRYVGVRTFADPTAKTAFHCPNGTWDAESRKSAQAALNDPQPASAQDLQRYKGFVFEPDRPISNSQLRRLRRMAMYQDK